MPQERRTLRIAMNIAALVAMGALLMSAMACSEDSSVVTSTSQPTATSRPADAIATSNPSPTATSNLDDTISSTDPQPSPEPTRSVPDDMVKTLAPIDSVEIRVAESHPQQYFVGVVSGLPNACVGVLRIRGASCGQRHHHHSPQPGTGAEPANRVRGDIRDARVQRAAWQRLPARRDGTP